MRPLTLSLSPAGGEGIETAPSPSERERVGVRVAPGFTDKPGWTTSVVQRRTVSRGEAWPTWMWAPELEPGMAPHAAMKGMPDARR